MITLDDLIRAKEALGRYSIYWRSRSFARSANVYNHMIELISSGAAKRIEPNVGSIPREVASSSMDFKNAL